MLCIFLLPAVAVVALLIFLPVIVNVYYSLFKWTAYSKKMDFVGMRYIKNYLLTPQSGKQQQIMRNMR